MPTELPPNMRSDNRIDVRLARAEAKLTDIAQGLEAVYQWAQDFAEGEHVSLVNLIEEHRKSKGAQNSSQETSGQAPKRGPGRPKKTEQD